MLSCTGSGQEYAVPAICQFTLLAGTLPSFTRTASTSSSLSSPPSPSPILCQHSVFLSPRSLRGRPSSLPSKNLPHFGTHRAMKNNNRVLLEPTYVHRSAPSDRPDEYPVSTCSTIHLALIQLGPARLSFRQDSDFVASAAIVQARPPYGRMARYVLTCSLRVSCSADLPDVQVCGHLAATDIRAWCVPCSPSVAHAPHTDCLCMY